MLAGLGFTRILSSGRSPSVGEGLDTLARMARQSAGRLQVMAGGGLRITDIPAARRSGMDAVHLSAKQRVSVSASGALSLGAGDEADPAAYYVNDAAVVRAACMACHST